MINIHTLLWIRARRRIHAIELHKVPRVFLCTFIFNTPDIIINILYYKYAIMYRDTKWDDSITQDNVVAV